MSGHKIIKVPRGVSLAVVGDIHEHSEQFLKITEEAKIGKTRWLVSVGDVYDKGWGIKHAQSITGIMQDLNECNICFAVRGNHELKQIKKTNGKLDPYLKWWSKQPLAITFEFFNGHKVLIVHGGVSPKLDESDLGKSVDICYIREIDENGDMISLKWEYDPKINDKVLVKSKSGTNWHKLYDGRMGYICSGHNSQLDGQAKFFNHSCNLDSAVYDTGILTCQIISENGILGETIRASGTARKPQINVIR